MTNLSLASAAVLLAAAPVVAPPTSLAIAPVRPAAPAAISRAAFVARLDQGFRVLDTDRNGVVTAAEIAAGETRAQQAADAAMATRRHAAFARLDTNHDGQLSQAEFDAAAASVPKSAGSDPAAMLAALDTDRDHKVSLTEYRARGLTRFDRADANHDGIVTPEEDRAATRR
jgi:Ca2+-binding EF-hand superfamily protein